MPPVVYVAIGAALVLLAIILLGINDRITQMERDLKDRGVL